MPNLKTTLKLTTVATITVALFVAALFGFNRLHLLATTSGAQSLPPLTPSSNSHSITPPPGFTPPNLTIIEQISPYSEMPTHYLSANDAAQLAAQYAWEVFGTDLNNRTIAMNTGTLHASHRTYWRAIVYSEVRAADHAARTALISEGICPYTNREYLADRINHEMRYIRGNPIMEHQDPLIIELDAITGERLSITRTNYQHPPRATGLTEQEIMNATINREHALTNNNPDPMDTLTLTPQELDTFSATAISYALRHHGNNAELLAWLAGTRPAYSFARDAYGRVVFSNHMLYFGLTCNDGNTIYVTLSYVSGQAVNITVLGNPMPRVPAQIEWPPPRPIEPPQVQTATIASRISNFTPPALIVYEIPSTPDRDTRARATPPQTAALYAAMYIWELFDNCINGFAVEMMLVPSSDNGALWQGTVLRQPCEYRIRHGKDAQLYRAQGNELFSFNMDAFTHEMISIRRAYNINSYICETITQAEMEAADLSRVHTLAPVMEFDQEIGRYIYVKTAGQMVGLTYMFTEPIVITRDANGSVIATDHHVFFEVLFTPAGQRPGTPRAVSLSVNASTGAVVWSFLQPE